MPYDTPHKKYLRLADSTVGLRGKEVLEVGGCSPPALLQGYGPRTWTCVNLDPQAVSSFNTDAAARGLTNCSAALRDIATYDANSSFEVIYSINSFEHISDLPTALAKMYRALKPGGHLFTLFGPIWSSDVGHHLSIPTSKGSLHFFDGILRPWEHLTSTPEKIEAKLEQLHGKEAAQRAVEYIYRYPDLNRLFEHEYLEIIQKSGFAPALVIRNRKGKPPRVPGATSTREFLMVLKKGRPRIWEKTLYPMKFGWAYLSSRSDA